MSNPDLAAGFSNPKVQAAIMDISQNPMNIVKYNDQPEVRMTCLSPFGFCRAVRRGPLVQHANAYCSCTQSLHMRVLWEALQS